MPVAPGRYGQASAWDSLGYIHHRLNRHSQAAASYQRALDLFETLGDRYNEAVTLTNLGDMREVTGEPDAAVAAWRQALDILNDLGHPDAEKVKTKLARGQS